MQWSKSCKLGAYTYFLTVSMSVKCAIKSGSCSIAMATESSCNPGEEEIILSITSGLLLKRCNI